MRWPWSTRSSGAPVTNHSVTPISTMLAGFFNSGTDLAGVRVNQGTALGISAFYRATALISGTLASLPLRTLTENGPGVRETTGSVFDDPGGPDGQTPYEWKESLLVHLLLHGNAYALKLRNSAGGLAALPLVHPLAVKTELPTPAEYKAGRVPAGGKWFSLTLADGESVRYDARDVWHVPGLSVDGLTGISILTAAKASLGTAIAGDRAAAKMFANGGLISGMAVPDEDLEPEEAQAAKEELDRSVSGWENAGKIAVLTRRLTFSPWQMNAVDAQFLQSRQFQIEEVSRWTGVPPHLLMQTEKQTSWGTGVDEQNRAMGRTVLSPWANRIEARGARVLRAPRVIEFDFTKLERPSPDRETELDLSQVAAGVMTVDEYRAKRGWKPLGTPAPEGDPA
jgi:HK97 family phage portal protein